VAASPIEAKLSCPVCRGELPLDLAAIHQPFDCPSCRRTVTCLPFPALTRPRAVGAAAGPQIENGATCFYHPDHSAQIPCDHCGRFLCALCDLPLNGRHLCPVCLDNTDRQLTENPRPSHRFLWGRAALFLSITPAIIYPMTLITFLTAPLAIILSLLWWKKPPGLTGSGGRLSLVLALIFSILQILAWITVVIVLVGILQSKAQFGPAIQEVFFL